jgi:DNA primase
LCPFHSEKTASFTVSADKGAFYCFGCGKGGGLIQFVMDVERLSFPEALRMLAERAGIELEAERRPSDEISRREYVELNSRIASTFQHLLRTSAEAAAARTYLQGRGIGDDAVADFKLGWAPAASGWLLKFLHGKQYSDRFLGQSGLFLARREAAAGGAPGLRELFRARLMFPIASARGEVIAFGGRTLAGDGVPKYVNSAETPFFRKNEQLFGLDRARALLRTSGPASAAAADGPRVVVVEGYTDVMALASLGVASVATLGTSFGDAHARLLKRQGFGATIMFDADDAGRTAALRALRILAQHEVPAAVAPLPPGSDPADLVAAGAGAQLQHALESPITASRYTIQTACTGTDLSTAEGKEQAFGAVLPYLLEVNSAITREGLLQEVAEQLRLDYDTVRAEFRRRTAGGSARRGGQAAGGRPRRPNPGTAAGSAQDHGTPAAAAATPGAELRLMLAVAVNREQFSVVRDRLEADELQDDRARALYIVLEDCYRHDQSDPDSLLLRIESDELRAQVARTLAGDEFSVNVEAYVAGGVRQVKSGTLERKRDRLMARIRRAEHEGSTEAVSELMADKIFLDSELNKLRGEAVSR